MPVNINNDARQHLRSDRQNLRVKTQIPCQVGPPGGETSVALILDLSCGGVKFSCNQQVVNKLFPEDAAPLGVVLDVFINIQFNLSEDDAPDALIKTGARVVHTERLAQDLFQVGVHFIDLTQAATEKLQIFIGEGRLD
jgi:c-di-GMP-binding flagellar brake protein YcgR